MSENTLKQQYDSALEKGKLDEALSSLNQMLEQEPDNDEYYLLRGQLNWRLEHRGDAMSDYRRAIAINPGSPAKEALEMATEIMNFYHRDLYNP